MEHEHQSGRLSIYGTADVYTDDSVGEGLSDRSGWVSTIDGPDQIMESRNDVTPLFEAELPLDEDALKELDDLLRRKMWDPHVERGTLHTADSYAWDDTISEVWNYAVHGHVRHYVDGVVQECQIDPRHPLREGIVRLLEADGHDLGLRDLVWAGDRWEIDGEPWHRWRDHMAALALDEKLYQSQQEGE